jgi:hypothetical protein
VLGQNAAGASSLLSLVRADLHAGGVLLAQACQLAQACFFVRVILLAHAELTCALVLHLLAQAS